METLYDNQWSTKRDTPYFNAKGVGENIDPGPLSSDVQSLINDIADKQNERLENESISNFNNGKISSKTKLIIGASIAGALLITAGVMAYKHFKK